RSHRRQPDFRSSVPCPPYCAPPAPARNLENPAQIARFAPQSVRAPNLATRSAHGNTPTLYAFLLVPANRHTNSAARATQLSGTAAVLPMRRARSATALRAYLPHALSSLAGTLWPSRESAHSAPNPP